MSTKKKTKPKTTVTSEYYEKIKKKAHSYEMLCRLLKCEGSKASGRIMDLQDLEKTLQSTLETKDTAKKLEHIICDADSLGTDIEDKLDDLIKVLSINPGSKLTIPGKMDVIDLEVKFAMATANQMHDGDVSRKPKQLSTLLHGIKERQRKKESGYRREIELLKHRQKNLKRALKSSLHTTAELGNVMGLFEEDAEKETND